MILHWLRCLPSFLLALMFGTLAVAEWLFSHDWTLAHVMRNGLTPGRPTDTLRYIEWNINVPILLVLSGDLGENWGPVCRKGQLVQRSCPNLRGRTIPKPKVNLNHFASLKCKLRCKYSMQVSLGFALPMDASGTSPLEYRPSLWASSTCRCSAANFAGVCNAIHQH